jgi:hypothetical protein
MADTNRMSPQQRRQMIAEAAYFRAERRGFRGGDPVADWLEAEQEIHTVLQVQEHDPVLEKLEQELLAASQKLKDLKARVSSLKAGARAEWDEDLRKLAKLRDGFARRLTTMRERGGKVTQAARTQARKVAQEITETIQRLEARRK